MRARRLIDPAFPSSDRVGWPWTDDTPPRPLTLSGSAPWPRVSLVMPALNHGDFLEEAIRSALLQAYPNLELIVVDGGSTDASLGVMRTYAPWIARGISEKDRGPAHALNKGFAAATGEILGFLNSDDLLLPGALASVVREFARHPEADVISGHGFLANASRDRRTPMFSDRWSLLRFSYNACVLVQAATFFRSGAFRRVRGFNEANRTAWDMELWADMALAGATFRRFDEFLAVYRLHDTSICVRLDLKTQRNRDRRAVRQKVKGRPETPRDRMFACWHRLGKFTKHPLRTLTQRRFFYSTFHRLWV